MAEVQVHFEHEDPDDEVQVTARCTDGAPRFEVERDRPYEEHPSGPLTS